MSSSGDALSAQILVAEDNPVNQVVAMEMLKIHGCAVTVVDNGVKALDALSNGRFDLVLMDCQMPELDGFGATREIRMRERTEASAHRIPVIALTANASESDREKCLESGMDDFLGKPFSQEQLRQVVERWL